MLHLLLDDHQNSASRPISHLVLPQKNGEGSREWDKYLPYAIYTL